MRMMPTGGREMPETTRGFVPSVPRGAWVAFISLSLFLCCCSLVLSHPVHPKIGNNEVVLPAVPVATVTIHCFWNFYVA
jgi:hypothetical protein